MATKSQLKQYFETGKIPTQAQFGDLIDSIFNIIGSPDGSLNINGDENNIKLSIKNYRNVQGLYTSQISISLHLFFNNDIKNSGKPVPVLIIQSNISSLDNYANSSTQYAVPNVTLLKTMQDDKIDYLTASLDVIIRRFTALHLEYYDLQPKTEVKKPSIVTITDGDFNNFRHMCNCIMGMGNNFSMIPVCIHNCTRSHSLAGDNYVSVYTMSVLLEPTYNGMTVESEWEKIMALQGYEDGLVIDNSGVVKNFINTICANCYREIQLTIKS